MSFNGAGVFQINTTGQPVIPATVISSTAFNALTADLATGLSTTLTKDGQSTATAVIPFALGLSADTIAEYTALAGVTVDSVLLKDGNITLLDSSDVTKKATFAMSTIATGTTRTFTFPNASGTLALAGATQTLTNTHIYVGNVSNVATDVALSGDATMANTGAITVASIGGKAVTLGGAFTMSGAFTYTGTITGNTSVTFPTSGTLLTNALTSAHLLVGSGGGVATDVAASGDLSLANTGAFTLATVNSNVGSFTAANITVNAKGLVTAASNGTASAFVQHVTTATAAVATGSTTVPFDNSIPQNTEGTEWTALATTITPTNVNNKLRVTLCLLLSDSTSNSIITSLFQDSTASAVATVSERMSTADQPQVTTLIFEKVAGSLTATTFKVRSGPESAATVTLNGTAGSRLYGGVASSTMTVEELTP